MPWVDLGYQSLHKLLNNLTLTTGSLLLLLLHVFKLGQSILEGCGPDDSGVGYWKDLETKQQKTQIEHSRGYSLSSVS